MTDRVHVGQLPSPRQREGMHADVLRAGWPFAQTSAGMSVPSVTPDEMPTAESPALITCACTETGRATTEWPCMRAEGETGHCWLNGKKATASVKGDTALSSCQLCCHRWTLYFRFHTETLFYISLWETETLNQLLHWLGGMRRFLHVLYASLNEFMVEVSNWRYLVFFFCYIVKDELCSQPCQECAQCAHPSINPSNSMLEKQNTSLTGLFVLTLTSEVLSIRVQTNTLLFNGLVIQESRPPASIDAWLQDLKK